MNDHLFYMLHILKKKKHKFSCVCLKDSGPFLESKFAGLTKVEIQCTEKESYNLTNYTWGYQVTSKDL
jgi:hypothetical protein